MSFGSDSLSARVDSKGPKLNQNQHQIIKKAVEDFSKQHEKDPRFQVKFRTTDDGTTFKSGTSNTSIHFSSEDYELSSDEKLAEQINDTLKCLAKVIQNLP